VALLLRRRPGLPFRDLAAAALVAAAGCGALLAFNAARFGDPFETGYQLANAALGQSMWVREGFGGRVAALLASPYRGLLVYSPVVVLASAGLAVPADGARRLLGWAGLATLACALLFAAGFRYWTGGHSWGPRFLVAAHVLLAPPIAALFERRPRWRLAVPILAGVQVFSVMLPASTEEYVRFNREQREPGSCGVWSLDCAPVLLRFPRALSALANTVAGEPGIVVEGRPAVPPEAVLESSDYRTLHWWPVRIAFRLGRIPLWVAGLVCLAGLGGAAALLAGALRAAAREDTSSEGGFPAGRLSTASPARAS
jgi:hypothetical protein